MASQTSTRLDGEAYGLHTSGTEDAIVIEVEDAA